MQVITQKTTSQDVVLSDLQRQVAQLSEALKNCLPGTLPSNTEQNPKEEAKAITLGKRTRRSELRQV